METVTKRLYEALFLVDSAEAAADWEGINEHIKKVLGRSEAEIISMRKWDDRPLAYEIQKRKRGTYILVYFNCISDKITTIERDSQLSERILRVLILRGDHLTAEDIEKETPANLTEKAAQKRIEEAAAKTAAAAEKAAEKPEDKADDTEEVVEDVKAEETAEPSDDSEKTAD